MSWQGIQDFRFCYLSACMLLGRASSNCIRNCINLSKNIVRGARWQRWREYKLCFQKLVWSWLPGTWQDEASCTCILTVLIWKTYPLIHMTWKQRMCNSESQAPAKYAWQEQSLLLCHVEHPWCPKVSDRTALPCNVSAKLEHIPNLEFHFIYPAGMLRDLQISAGWEDWHLVN